MSLGVGVGVGVGGEMNCSLLPQNENSDLALGRLTLAESYFQQWRRAKKTKSGNFVS